MEKQALNKTLPRISSSRSERPMEAKAMLKISLSTVLISFHQTKGQMLGHWTKKTAETSIGARTLSITMPGGKRTRRSIRIGNYPAHQVNRSSINWPRRRIKGFRMMTYTLSLRMAQELRFQESNQALSTLK